MKSAFIFSTVLGIILTLICYLFTNQIVSVFLTDQSAFDYAVQFARVLLCTGPAFGIYYVFTNALQAMGAAKASLVVNVSRQGLVYIPALFILNALFGITGLVWAQPAADVISIIMGIIMYLLLMKKNTGGQLF
ncbi:MAG: MATE family efflux transporter [Lachnospiraceae bacterium]|nr:MATE family efflux transporter [Lachnospiraceae bacterium]